MPRLCPGLPAIVLALAVALAAPGCAELRETFGLKTPSARVVGVDLEDIGLQAVTLAFDVEVTNPLSAPLPLANVDYALASGGQGFMSGRAPLEGTVAAGSTRTVRLPVAVKFAELLKAVKGIRPGAVVPYEAEVGLSVDVPAAGPLRLPLKKEGNLPVPAPPQVEIAEITWDRLTLEQATGRVLLNIVNANQFPVNLQAFQYTLALGGTGVADTRVAQPVSFAADGGAAPVEIPITLSPRSLGMAVFNMLTGKEAGYDLKGTMDLATPFGPMALPVEKIGRTILRK